MFLRKVMCPVRLWLGLPSGPYIVLLSLTGIALVLRDDLDEAFETPV